MRGEYNRRREECEQGLKHFAKSYPGVRALRDVSAATLETHRDGFPIVIYNRCLHVLQENQRVFDGAEYLERGDLLEKALSDFGVAARQEEQIDSSDWIEVYVGPKP